MVTASITLSIRQRSAPPQPIRDSPCRSSLNTEYTEYLSDLCVAALLATEDTEEPTKRARILAGRQRPGEANT